MMDKLHDGLGLSDRAPEWVLNLSVVGPLVLIFMAIAGWQLRVPVHIAYHEAPLIANLSGSGGIAKGDRISVDLGTDTPELIQASLRLPEAVIGSRICIQELTDAIRGGQYYVTAPAHKCIGPVALTSYRIW